MIIILNKNQDQFYLYLCNYVLYFEFDKNIYLLVIAKHIIIFFLSFFWAMMEIVHETVRYGETFRISMNGTPDLLCRIFRNISHELSPLSLKGGF